MKRLYGLTYVRLREFVADMERMNVGCIWVRTRGHHALYVEPRAFARFILVLQCSGDAFDVKQRKDGNLEVTEAGKFYRIELSIL